MCPRISRHQEHLVPGASDRLPVDYWPDCRLLPDDSDVLRLWALLPLGDLELYDLTLLQIPKPLTRDPGVMDEHILAFLWSDETIPLLAVEPLDRAFWHTLFLPPLGPVALSYAPFYTTASARILPPVIRTGPRPPRTP